MNPYIEKLMPHAFSAKFISEDMHYIIAAHMAQSVKAEQYANGYKPGAMPVAEVKARRVSKERAAIFKELAKRMTPGSIYTTRHIMDWSGSTAEICRAIMSDMVREGHAERVASDSVLKVRFLGVKQ